MVAPFVASVTRATEQRDERQRATFIEYTVSVTYNPPPTAGTVDVDLTWQLNKRYSDFEVLHQRLKKDAKGLAFPVKSWSGHETRRDRVQDRWNKLDTWLRGLCQRPLSQLSVQCLSEFIGMEAHLAEFRAIEDKQQIVKDLDPHHSNETLRLKEQIELLLGEKEALKSELEAKAAEAPKAADSDAFVQKDEMIRILTAERDALAAELASTVGRAEAAEGEALTLAEALAAKQAECTALEERLAQEGHARMASTASVCERLLFSLFLVLASLF